MRILGSAARRRRRAACLAALALAAGCGAVQRPGPAAPGLSADTATREGLTAGATATEAACRALPDGVWVEAGRRAECLRYAAAGFEVPAPVAVVHLPGDPGGATYRVMAGQVQVEGVSEAYELSDAARQASAEARSAALGGLPVVVLGRPGMHGSSGDHARDRQTPAEVALVDAAIDALRARHGFRRIVLVGFSSGGAIAADLLARRTDIACAVIASAPLDLGQYYRQPDGTVPDGYAKRAGELADPMRSLPRIRPAAEVFVIGDRNDRRVPASAWTAWVAAARRAGLHVHTAEVAGQDRPDLAPDGAGGVPSRHLTVSPAQEVAAACARGVPPERIAQALRSDGPLLALEGRRLGGEEIRGVLAGRRLRGLQWRPFANLLADWAPDGTLTSLSLGREARPIAHMRWWIDGDRLCTERHGCGEVLARGDALLLVDGSPPALRLVVLTGPPGPA